MVWYFFFLFFFSFSFSFRTILLSSFWISRVIGVVPSPPRFLPSIFIAHRVQQSHCSWIFHRVLLTHALALSASQFVHKKKSQRIHTSMHSAGLELTKLTYTRLEDNLIRHRGDRCYRGTSVPRCAKRLHRQYSWPPALLNRHYRGTSTVVSYISCTCIYIYLFVLIIIIFIVWLVWVVFPDPVRKKFNCFTLTNCD